MYKKSEMNEEYPINRRMIIHPLFQYHRGISCFVDRVSSSSLFPYLIPALLPLWGIRMDIVSSSLLFIEFMSMILTLGNHRWIYIIWHPDLNKISKTLRISQRFEETFVFASWFPSPQDMRKFDGKNDWNRLQCENDSLIWLYPSRINNMGSKLYRKDVKKDSNRPKNEVQRIC